MTTSSATQPALKLNFNNRDYEFDELPRTAQMLLQDMMRLDQQIGKLQFELRHLQAAKQVYGSSLRKTMNDEAEEQQEGGNGHSHDQG